MTLTEAQQQVLDRLRRAPRADWHSADSLASRLHRRDTHNIERTLRSLVRAGVLEQSAAGLRIVYRIKEGT